MNSDHFFNDEFGQQGTFLTYDKYRGRFNKVMKRVNMNEYILKLIVGHAIDDITENTYTHRTIEDLHREIQKVK